MTTPELRKLTTRMFILGMLLAAVVLVATPAHAAVAAGASPDVCWNPCTLLQILFPRLMCAQVCF